MRSKLGKTSLVSRTVSGCQGIYLAKLRLHCRKLCLVSEELNRWWSTYFLAKLYLHCKGFLDISASWNLGFLVWLAFPVVGGAKNGKSLRLGKTILDLFLGFLLLWHDSWLPPLLEGVVLLWNPDTRPTGDFLSTNLVNFIISFFSISEVAALALIYGLVSIAHRAQMRLTRLVVLSLCLAGFHSRIRASKIPAGLFEDELADFHATEATRRVQFPNTPGEPVDIILLHICSLGWDDLDIIDMMDDPFFDKFDYLFEEFNSVTPNSVRSAIYLLRSKCGQSSNNDLFQKAPAECYLMDQLQRLGYATYSAQDHNGKTFGFQNRAIKFGRMPIPPLPDFLPAQLVSYDGSDIYEHNAVFDNWLYQRAKDGAERAALYVNMMALHSGLKWKVEKDGDKNKDEVSFYKERLKNLFQFVDAMEEKIRASGRSALVVFVPEHSAGLRSTKIQNALLREFPTPRITNVPLGLRFVGPAFPKRPASTIRTNRKVSYLALAEIIAQTIKDPEQAAANLPYDRLPETRYVGDHVGANKVIFWDGKYILQTSDGKRVTLESEELGPKRSKRRGIRKG